MVLEYRTGGSGYWVAVLLPLAIYFTRFQNDYYLGVQNYQNNSSILSHDINPNPSKTSNGRNTVANASETVDDDPSVLGLLIEPSTVILLILIKNSLLLTIAHTFFSEVDYKTVLQTLKSYNTILTTVILSCTLVSNGYMYEKFAYLAVNFVFPYVFYHLIKYYPKSFTFGEALTVTQGFCFAFWSAVNSIPIPPTQLDKVSEDTLVILLSEIGLLAVIILSRFLVIAKRPWTFVFMEEFLGLWSKCCLAVMAYRMDLTDLIYFAEWVSNFYFLTKIRIALFAYWSTLFLLALAFVAWTNFTDRQTSTMDRKYFHFLVVAVFLPGILLDYNMLFLSSVALTYIFLLLELIRFLDIHFQYSGIGKWIDDSIGQFRDRQDEGELIITHIYLLVGCSLPVWLHGVGASRFDPKGWNLLGVLAGVLSVGIGDTFASIGGKKFGTIRWAGNGKSLEGTICSIASQAIALLLLAVSGVCSMTVEVLICGLISIFVNALVESTTSQIDNFVLPLVTFNSIHGLKLFLS